MVGTGRLGYVIRLCLSHCILICSFSLPPLDYIHEQLKKRSEDCSEGRDYERKYADFYEVCWIMSSIWIISYFQNS